MQPKVFMRRGPAVLVVVALAILSSILATPAHAQTDYYNLDGGRPLRIEDALPIERHAFEWQIAPIRLSGGRSLGSVLSVEPQLAWGILPRTQIEVGLPLQRWQQRGRVVTGAAGVELSALHALNAETMSLPALAIAGDLLIPAGAFGRERTYATLTALATRTLPFGRVHVNASYTAGRGDESRTVTRELADEVKRWEAGIAADHTFPLRSMLVGAELVARRPIDAADVEWIAASGVRYQVGPRLSLDAGIGRSLARDGEWFVTFGSAVSFALIHRVGGVR